MRKRKREEPAEVEEAVEAAEEVFQGLSTQRPKVLKAMQVLFFKSGLAGAR